MAITYASCRNIPDLTLSGGMSPKVTLDWKQLPAHQVLDALDTLRQRIRAATRNGQVHLPALRASVAGTADPLLCALLDDVEAWFETDPALNAVSAAR